MLRNIYYPFNFATPLITQSFVLPDALLSHFSLIIFRECSHKNLYHVYTAMSLIMLLNLQTDCLFLELIWHQQRQQTCRQHHRTMDKKTRGPFFILSIASFLVSSDSLPPNASLSIYYPLLLSLKLAMHVGVVLYVHKSPSRYTQNRVFGIESITL